MNLESDLTHCDRYPANEAPLFHKGAGVSLMSAVVLVATGAGLSLYVVYTNRKRSAFLSGAGMDHVVSDKDRLLKLGLRS